MIAPNGWPTTKWPNHSSCKGAPIIIVMPGGVYGPGDNSWAGRDDAHVLSGLPPVFAGAGNRYHYPYVDDVAEGPF